MTTNISSSSLMTVTDSSSTSNGTNQPRQQQQRNNTTIPTTPRRTSNTSSLSLASTTPSSSSSSSNPSTVVPNNNNSNNGWWSKVRNSVTGAGGGGSNVASSLTDSNNTTATPNRLLLRAFNRGFFTPSNILETTNTTANTVSSSSSTRTVPSSSSLSMTTNDPTPTIFEKRLQIAQQQYQRQHAATNHNGTVTGSNPTTLIVYSTPNGIRTNHPTAVSPTNLSMLIKSSSSSSSGSTATTISNGNDTSVSLASRLPSAFVNEVIRQQEELNNSLKEQLRKLEIKSDIEQQIHTNSLLLLHLENHFNNNNTLINNNSSNNANDNTSEESRYSSSDNSIPVPPTPNNIPKLATLFSLSSPTPSSMNTSMLYSLPPPSTLITEASSSTSSIATPASQSRIPPHARWKNAVSTVQKNRAANVRNTPLPSRTGPSPSLARIVALSKQQQNSTENSHTPSVSAADVVRRLLAQEHSSFNLSTVPDETQIPPTNENNTTKNLSSSLFLNRDNATMNNTYNNNQENQLPTTVISALHASLPRILPTHINVDHPPSPVKGLSSSSLSLSHTVSSSSTTVPSASFPKLPPEAKKGRLPVPLVSATT